MNETDLLDNWLQYKKSDNFYRLLRPVSIEYEYNHPRGIGNPSTYAFVKFDCMPSDFLRFETHVNWQSFGVEERESIGVEQRIAEAIVDALVSSSFYPSKGCFLKLTEIKWDEVSSSEASFYIATKAAITDSLLKHDLWEIVAKCLD